MAGAPPAPRPARPTRRLRAGRADGPGPPAGEFEPQRLPVPDLLDGPEGMALRVPHEGVAPLEHGLVVEAVEERRQAPQPGSLAVDLRQDCGPKALAGAADELAPL